MVIIPFFMRFLDRDWKEKMEYQKFKIMIQERLQAMMGESVEIKIESYYKNNQTRVESLILKEKNPASKIVFSPAIHLQDLYRLYILHSDGEELADCLHQIQKLYEKQEPKSIKHFPEDWNEVKSRGSRPENNRRVRRESGKRRGK